MTVHLLGPIQLEEEVERLIEWLATFGKTEKGGVTRLLYSEQWLSAQEALKEKMEECGLAPYFDDVGNLFGRAEGSSPSSKTILTGSHIDTVIEGGKYDGAYGIIAGLLATHYLLKRFGTPKKTIEVVSLCEEEGSRFPLTFWGSGSVTGRRSFKHIQKIVDSKGISFVQAMNECGFGQERFRQPFRNDIQCFIELHIEQGSVLEKKKKSLGIVSDIVGQRRYQVKVVGESNHAGTTPMSCRKDAVAIASELITYLMKQAKQVCDQLRVTVGKIKVEPNVPNVIAGEVVFTIDIRHHEEEMLEQFCSTFSRHFKNVSAQYNVDILLNEWLNVKPVKMDQQLLRLSKEIAEEQNLSHEILVSGAGHDSQMFGTYCPTALFFVPSHNGISHSPKEYTAAAHLESGVKFLIHYLYRLAY